MAPRLTGAVILALTLAVGCGVTGSPQVAASPVRSLERQPGESATALVGRHCGYEWLEVEVNGELWRTTEFSSELEVRERSAGLRVLGDLLR